MAVMDLQGSGLGVYAFRMYGVRFRVWGNVGA